MTSQTTNNWSKWLQENYPNVKALDHDWTMTRYSYPTYVMEYIMNKWIKVSDLNGGTYTKPNLWKRETKNKCRVL